MAPKLDATWTLGPSGLSGYVGDFTHFYDFDSCTALSWFMWIYRMRVEPQTVRDLLLTSQVQFNAEGWSEQKGPRVPLRLSPEEMQG